ncbi:ATP-binding protein [Alteromonas mediterranea]|uniref:histidine kinase n=3 Tax=Alteromonas mediterranea TaxID=314275 RepID=S5AJ66_9ALTE|nr:ATP-binding protein [Alteromonas mediterranea]AGP79514.1 Signal transduction histidine kinase [Alteromonas mediterranea 615]MDY6884014.1 ATP-binding protein [Pseudomonadota bacterium]AEA99968.1 histidine kinase [Alteromonas mediterranea DE]AFV87300.1 Signal transduction histidine kinase [Alteromonas mediterranea DE1]AGP99316.1 Signal transduction histidine kinase [Alteromonas mediterranea UM7]|tara:strand:+ start:2427 stop:4352 length:1926 start_codon:yes stop_codon:yes gene_type:complete
MRIKSKLLIIYIPILLIGMALTGYWAYLTAYDSVREREYQLLTQTLSLNVLEIIDERRDLLIESGLENVPVFRDAYQKEVFEELKSLHQTTDRHFAITDKSTETVIFSTMTRPLVLDVENANKATIANRSVAFGESNVNDADVLFACAEFAPWNWKVTILQPADSLQSSLSTIASLTSLVTLFAVVIVSLLMGKVTQVFVVSPIEKIKSAASRIALDHKKVNIDLQQNDELGRLARDVEAMSGEIEQYVAQAQQANRAKTDFLAVMSHEIRTPLNGIQGLATLLLDTPLTEKQHQYASDLKSSASILATVINDVLDLSKIESGMSEIDVTEFALDNMLRDLITLLGTNASANNTRLVYTSKNMDSVAVTSDITKLRQIIINLVSNAIKFTHKGTVSISAKLKKPSTEEVCENRLVVAVKDTGIGIEPDRLEHIFDKFTQSDSSITREYGGTGLGLAIARQLAQLLGGDIKVVSKVGEGSCFTVTANVQSRLKVESSTHLDEGRDVQGASVPAGLKVLLAEDNAINAVVAQALLEQLQCDVEHVDNGLKATARVEEGGIDVVFMDVHMPVMDGIEATKRIRKLDGTLGQIPVIGLTAEAFKERHIAFKEAGMDDIVTKPVTIEALQESLLKLAIGQEVTDNS